MNRPTMVDSNMRDHMLGLLWGLLGVPRSQLCRHVVFDPTVLHQHGSNVYRREVSAKGQNVTAPGNKFTDLPRRRRCASGPMKLERQFNVQRATHACPTVTSSHAC
jgi:hypothetical protein